VMQGVLRRALRSLLHRLANWQHALHHTGNLGLLLIPGTGILDDFSTGPWGAPYALFRWCLAARLQGVRIAFVSIGAGPIRHPLSRWFMKAAARLAQYRSYRDELSRSFMRSIGFPVGSDEVYPDIAFTLPDPPAPPAAEGAGLTVGVGVMAYYGWSNDAAKGQAIYDTYIGKITQFVQWLLEEGHRVRLVTGELADARAVEDVLQRVGREAGGRIEAEPAFSLADVTRQMAGTDLVVATRFHNVVCALKLGRPTVSLSYARKNDVLLADMGLGDFCQHVEEFDLDRLKAQFTALATNRAAHAERVRSTVAAYREQLRRQEETLLATVLRR
jgi:polysaccharide pyruvyl transferase WcaK-like protein